MKKVCAIFLNAEKEYSSYEVSNKYTEQNVKNAYKIAQNWIAYFIKYAAYMRVELNEENMWMRLF